MTEERAPRPLWPEWVDYVEARKMGYGDRWQVRAIGDLAVEPWEKMIGSTRRVAVEHTSEDYDEAVAETSKRAWWKQEEVDA